MKNLIFIFSLPRSGSTLLQSLLASHTEVSSVSEPWILLPLLYMRKNHGIFTEYSHATCQIAINDFINELPRKETDYYNAIAEIGVQLYSKVADKNATYFLDKTPRYYLIIPEIAKAFPDAKYIFLFRNPIAIISSIINSWNKNRLGLHRNYIDLYQGPKLLVEGYEMLKTKSITIKYEDLVSNPQDSMGAVMDYLGLKYESSIFKMAGRATLRGRMGDKANNAQYSRITDATVKTWMATVNTTYRKKFMEKYLDKIGSEVLKACGYDIAQLKNELDSLQVSRLKSIIDWYDMYRVGLYRILKIPLYREQIQRLRKAGVSLFLHS